jgi:hypothetical protein
VLLTAAAVVVIIIFGFLLQPKPSRLLGENCLLLDEEFLANDAENLCQMAEIAKDDPRISILTPVDQVERPDSLNPEETTPSTCTHYVSPTGDDANNGSSPSTPFGSIMKGVNSITAGDVLCVRDGVYYEAISISQSGSPSQPITIMAFPGETPIIDGRAGLQGVNTGLPKCNNGCSGSQLAKIDPISGKGHVWPGLVNITGSHIVFDGFEITRSMGRGINIERAQDVKITNCDVHHSRHGGILAYKDTSDILVESCKFWWNAEFAPYSRSSSTLNWPVIVLLRGQNILARNNVVFNNWGEGMAAGRDSRFVTIESNTVYDNYALQIYVNHAQDVVINRNLTYFSADTTFYRGTKPSECIAINNETEQVSQLSRNIEVTNNIAAGCRYNFGLWSQGDVNGTENLLVSHNTFVEGFEGGIRISDATDVPHKNVRFKNNIIVQSSGNSLSLETTIGITFSHNLWWPKIYPRAIQSKQGA